MVAAVPALPPCRCWHSSCQPPTHVACSHRPQIFLVGTAHVSKASAEEVRDMIRLVRPQAVMVELCPPRAAHLRTGPAGEQDLLKVRLLVGGVVLLALECCTQ